MFIKQTTGTALYLLLTALILSPWFIFQVQHHIEFNISWLTEAAGRLLAGGHMSTDFYDTNPPLSILLYLPPAFLNKYMAVPVHYATFLYSLCLVLLSTFSAWCILRQWNFQDKNFATFLSAGYLIVCTIPTGWCFGERDHYIALGLVPLALVQTAITFGIPISSRLKVWVLILGSIATLIKPHYLLIPAALISYRIIKQRRITAIFDLDCCILSVITFAYAALIYFVFNDFLTIILPDSLLFYVHLRTPGIWKISCLLTMIIVAMSFVVISICSKPLKNLSLGFLFLAWLCLIPFTVQAKGLFYQILPMQIFLSCSLAIIIYCLTKELSKRLRFSFPFIQFSLSIIALSVIAYFYMPLNPNDATHSQYLNSPLGKFIHKLPPHSSYLLLGDLTEASYPLASYEQHPFASRFPYFWFIAPIVQSEKSCNAGHCAFLSKDEVRFYKSKYQTLVIEDLIKYKPEVVLLGPCTYYFGGKNCAESFINFFSGNPAFTKIWKGYEFKENITLYWKDYFPGMINGAMQDSYSYAVYYKTDNN